MSKRPPTTEEELWMNLIAALDCVVCRNSGLGNTPAEIHHPQMDMGLSQRAGHFLTLPLCDIHHRNGTQPGVARHHGKKEWQTKHKTTEIILLDQVIGEAFHAIVTRR